jgi:CRISPR-associated endonuclease/helicase Cas3
MARAFEEFFAAAVGRAPYAYQRRLAEGGLPELLRVPTGAGKTAAAVLPWLWRRLEGPGDGPGRLVFVLPLRSLVEQTVSEVRGWVGKLGVADRVDVHVLMGGEAHDPDAWQVEPSRVAVFVGTQDMVLSRLLMRGYGESRSRWPVSFGLLHSDVQFVFDETQLLGPGLGTSVQLQGLREALGTVAPSRTMWMSATVDPGELCTADHPEVRGVVGLTEEDRVGPLAVRLDARRRVERVKVSRSAAAYPAEVARVLLERHVTGTQTIAVLNTVDRAVKVREALGKLVGAADDRPELLLVHSRFRPTERRRLAERLKSEEPLPPAGRIVVSTQVLEAGVDISSRVLFTEAASFASIVQRAGRSNRAGEFPDGTELLWAPPPEGRGWAAPYDEGDVERAIAVLESLEGVAVTSTDLQETRVEAAPVVHPLLRRRDLLNLFDTMPDLSGADIDVSPWIRDANDTTVWVAWRSWPGAAPADEAKGKEPWPGRDELCPAPVADVRGLLREESGRLWTLDAVDGVWRRARQADVHPGAVLLTSAQSGWYDAELGWGVRHRAPVEPVTGEPRGAPDGMGGNPSTAGKAWQELVPHLEETEEEVRRVVAEGGPMRGLDADLAKTACLAARYHDLGKAHAAFRDNLRRSCPPGVKPPGPGPWAKSPYRPVAGKPRYFRHELVTALALLHEECGLLDGHPRRDLVAYLAAAHHGKVRVSVRSMPGEAEQETPLVLGLRPVEQLGEVVLPGGAVLPPLTLGTSVLFFGAGAKGQASWVQRASGLLAELGPFRLALLEALVRVADWRASSAYGKPAATREQREGGAGDE